ncbi:MAG: SBBP repeat-containing protein [Flavobacteriales bacterium]|nr:SBBP repeat-containing protein [Flavobacteriales bacterium]
MDPAKTSPPPRSLCLLLFHGHLDAQSLQWAGQLGSPGSVYTQAIALDADGNTYTTGWFSGTADFDPGTATANLTVGVGGNTDIFVSKLDALGQFVWVKQLGGNGYDYARAIALDQAGNIHIAGDFQGTADFDPAPNTLPITSNAGGAERRFRVQAGPVGQFHLGQTHGRHGQRTRLRHCGEQRTRGVHHR